MRTLLFLPVVLLAVTVAPAQSPAVCVAPISISVSAPIKEQHNPHLALGAPFNSWILALATVVIGPDGRVIDVIMRPISVAGLGSKTGAFKPLTQTLLPRDARLFESVALAALEGARFESGDGGPRRSFVNFAWKAYGGSMDVGAAESGGTLRHSPGVLARTFAKGTTFYFWGGVDVAIEAKRFEAVDGDNRRRVLGLPSESFAEKLAPGCRVLDGAPSGRWAPNLDDDLRPLERLEPAYPDAERRDRAQGIVLMMVQVAPDGSVSGVYPSRTTPGRPAFAESAIRSTCRLRFNEPRFDGEAVYGLHWQHAEFETSGP